MDIKRTLRDIPFLGIDFYTIPGTSRIPAIIKSNIDTEILADISEIKVFENIALCSDNKPSNMRQYIHHQNHTQDVFLSIPRRLKKCI